MAENSADFPQPKNPKIPRRQSSVGTEAGLWNLDEESPSSEAASTTPEATASQQNEDAIVRIEKGTLNLNKKGIKLPKQSRVREVTSPRSAETKAAIEKEKIKPSPTPYKNPGKTIGPTEDEVWADFDAEITPAVSEQPIVSEQHIATPEAPVPKKTPDSSPVRTLDLSQNTPPKKAPLITSPAKVIDPIDELTPGTEQESSEAIPSPVAVDSSDTPALSSDESDASSPVTAAQSVQITKFSRLEVIASLAFLFLLLAGGFIGLKLFQNNVKTQENPYTEPEFPIKGAMAHVVDASTYWRAPIKEGPNADPTQRDVTLIPVIDLTLDETKSESGVIRVMFYNEAGTIVGDIVTREFTNHRFALSGSSRLSFTSTSGFTNFGEQEAYRANLTKPWTIKVFEGPDINAPSSSFLLLFSTPISTERH